MTFIPHVPRRACALLALAVSLAAPLAAQGTAAGVPDDTLAAVHAASHAGAEHAAASPAGRLVRRSDAVLLAGAVAGSAAISLFDGHIALEMEEREMQQRRTLRRTSAIASSVGGAGPVAFGLALLAAGGATGNHRLVAVGREATWAVLGTGLFGYAAKGIVGRTRPTAAPGDPDVYRLGRGFVDASRTSFPSGHTAASFAVATVVSSELPHDRPALRWAVSAVAFGGAGLVGFSRVYRDQHWVSDVVSGAALGIIGGRIAVRREHRRVGMPSPALGRLLDHATVDLDGRGGVVLSWALR